MPSKNTSSRPHIPSLTNPLKKPGRKPKAELLEVTRRVGRPPDAIKAKMQELQARLVLGNSDAVLARIVAAAQDPEDPAYVACLKLLADRILPMDGFAGKADTPAVLQVEITDYDGKVTRVTSGKVAQEPLHQVIDMGDVDVS